MKHLNIAATLGITEVEDLTEGFFLQPEEAKVVDAALGKVTATAAELVTANETIGTHVATIAGLNTQATADQATITGLQAQVAKLDKKPSGSGSVITAPAAAEVVEEKETEKPGVFSADHPANILADSKKSYNRGF